jgi:transposase
VLCIPPTTKLWYGSAVDLRLGFDGLANLVRTQLSADPLSVHLFVFTDRSANRVKVLYWAGTGTACGARDWRPGGITSPRPPRPGLSCPPPSSP